MKWEDGGQCGVGGYCDKCYWKEQAMVYKENLLEAKALFDKMTKPLSEDEISKLWKGNVESCGWDNVFNFAREIEAKVRGEK